MEVVVVVGAGTVLGVVVGRRAVGVGRWIVGLRGLFGVVIEIEIFAAVGRCWRCVLRRGLWRIC